MHCDDAKNYLFEYVDDKLDERLRRAIGDHIEHCEDCAQEYATSIMLQRQAEAWHEETPPAWQPPVVRREATPWLSFMQWFPTLASSAALVMVAVMFYNNQTQPTPGVEQLAQPSASYPLSAATESVLVRNVLESSRDQRQEELEALVKLLKAEMDRRSLETEESLRYVIAHQIQEQQELDNLQATLQQLQTSEQPPGGGL